MKKQYIKPTQISHNLCTSDLYAGSPLNLTDLPEIGEDDDDFDIRSSEFFDWDEDEDEGSWGKWGGNK